MSIPQGLYIASHCAEKMPTNLADLSHCRCILQSGETQWSFRIGNDLTVQPVSGRLVMNSPDMQLQAAVRGLGLARLARYQAELALRRGALVEVLLEGKPVAQQLTVVYRSRQLPLKTQLFLDHFQNHIGRLYSLL
jgi:DNA-binding transcriptional LysR family regulator